MGGKCISRFRESGKKCARIWISLECHDEGNSLLQKIWEKMVNIEKKAQQGENIEKLCICVILIKTCFYEKEQ